MKKRLLSVLIALCLVASCTAKKEEDPLAAGFVTPPDSARPWVYWFWLNGNITREGITADLEAMKRVGIGGVLIMEVDQGAPVGPADFMGAEWRELFKHAVAEAGRLGLEVNMNNDAGWNGSGGPWITPEQSMQKVVWTRDDARRAEALRRHAPAAGGGPRLLPGHRRAGLPDAGRLPHRRHQGQGALRDGGTSAHGRRDEAPAGDDHRPRPHRRSHRADGRRTAASPGTCRRASGRSCASATRRPASRTPPRPRAAAASSATS